MKNKEKNDYSASLTGNPFLFFETRQVARLLLQGLDQQSILEEIIQSNLFQYSNSKNVVKRFNAIYKRIYNLNRTILDKLANGSAAEAKIIIFLVLLKGECLFGEFFVEVIQELFSKFQINFYNTPKDAVRKAVGRF